MKNNILEIKNWKLKIGDFRRGMTYVELIVVLSIFSVITSVVLFNYGDFQAKVDIKNLASDIALKVVEAQKSSLSGQWNLNAPIDWKPSYGVYFDADTPTEFIYFANLDTSNFYDPLDSILDRITITHNNRISGLEAVGCASVTKLSIIFRRPDSSAQITSDGISLSCASYVKITIVSPKSVTATIKIYPSGRIQIN